MKKYIITIFLSLAIVISLIIPSRVVMAKDGGNEESYQSIYEKNDAYDEIENEGQDKEEKKVLSIIKEDGTKEEVELLICFTFNDTKKEYVVYTRNEKDENGNVTVYISSVDRSGEIPKMGAIESDEEWSKIKDVLRELSKND